MKPNRNTQTWKIILFFIVMLPFWGNSQGKAVFTSTASNLGTIHEEEGPVESIFVFTNKGTGPIAITSVKSVCGCTAPEWSSDPVAVGSQGFIKVVYNPANRPGYFSKGITVSTDGRPSVQVLKITGKVIPRPKGPRELYPFEEGNLRLRSNHLTFGRAYKDETVSRTTVLYNQGKRPIRFSPARTELPPYLKVRLDTLVLLPGKTTQMEISYNASMQGGWGFIFENFFLVTSDRNKPMKRINVSIEIKERFDKSSTALAKAPRLLLGKASVDFGKVAEGGMFQDSIQLKNTGKSTLIVREIESPCGCTRTRLSKPFVEPGQSEWLYVSFNSKGREGPQLKELKIICNDPRKPERNLVVKAAVNARPRNPE